MIENEVDSQVGRNWPAAIVERNSNPTVRGSAFGLRVGTCAVPEAVQALDVLTQTRQSSRMDSLERPFAPEYGNAGGSQ
jgi:hypothetical protein